MGVPPLRYAEKVLYANSAGTSERLDLSMPPRNEGIGSASSTVKPRSVRGDSSTDRTNGIIVVTASTLGT